jgi:lysophospholipid acyltransferase (LPLAT)-like uncharacterized protein
VAFVAALVLRVWLGTLRVRVRAADGRHHPTDPSAVRFVYAFWHDTLLGPTRMRTRVNVLVSQSADGELITQVCRWLGIGVMRGSTTRGGAQGLLELLREGAKGHFALTPDGPRGPRHRAKSGVVLLAAHTGLPIVAWGVGFTRAWRAKSWDRFAIPLPFSTIVGVMADPIVVPRELDRDGIEQYRQRVEDAMRQATAAADAWAEQLAAPSPRGASIAAQNSHPNVLSHLPAHAPNCHVAVAQSSSK